MPYLRRLLVAALAIIAIGCGLRFFDRPPIAVTNDIVVAFEWSVTQAHDELWISDADFFMFLRVDRVLRDVIAANPTTPKAAARDALASFRQREVSPTSRLMPYLLVLEAALS